MGGGGTAGSMPRWATIAAFVLLVTIAAAQRAWAPRLRRRGEIVASHSRLHDPSSSRGQTCLLQRNVADQPRRCRGRLVATGARLLRRARGTHLSNAELRTLTRSLYREPRGDSSRIRLASDRETSRNDENDWSIESAGQNPIRASLQVAKSAPRTVSKWRRRETTETNQLRS
jgi:hypothetical protein